MSIKLIVNQRLLIPKGCLSIVYSPHLIRANFEIGFFGDLRVYTITTPWIDTFQRARYIPHLNGYWSDYWVENLIFRANTIDRRLLPVEADTCSGSRVWMGPQQIVYG